MSRVSQGDFTDCMRLKRCNILPCRSVSCFLIGAWRSFHTCAACVHLFICIYTHRHFSCLHFCAPTVLFNFNFIDQYFLSPTSISLSLCVSLSLFFLVFLSVFNLHGLHLWIAWFEEHGFGRTQAPPDKVCGFKIHVRCKA